MNLTLQNKKQNNIKVLSYHPNVQDEIRRVYMQNCGGVCQFKLAWLNDPTK